MIENHWMRTIVRKRLGKETEVEPIDLGNTLMEVWDTASKLLHISDQDLISIIADHYNLQIADMANTDEILKQLIPEKLARKYLVLPVFEDQHGLVIATSDPGNKAVLDNIRFVAGRNIIPAVSSPSLITDYITYEYSSDQDSSTLLKTITPSGEKTLVSGDKVADSRKKGSAVTHLLDQILYKAVKLGSSDIHIQPHAGGGIVRFRVDGLLQRSVNLTRSVLEPLIRRIKAAGNMDISNNLIPHDGGVSFRLAEKKYDLRISTLPTESGERAVIRLLNQSAVYSLKELKYLKSDYERMLKLSQGRMGMVLMTGPTGSGKTTTLYSLLAELNRVDVNIMTVENPVEYKMPGISQIEINPGTGLTFANVLRSFLRQDPDIILVGEIRDEETAEIALRSVLTGRLVLSTLHTIDAAGAFPRLLDLGVSISKLADGLNAVVAQRLLRRLCQDCATEITEDLSAGESYLQSLTGRQPPKRATGCSKCNNSGYKGRVPVIEILEITPSVRKLLHSGNIETEHIVSAARKEGMLCLGENAIERIMSGDTTVEEAFRVLGHKLWTDLAIAHGHQPGNGPPAVVEEFHAPDCDYHSDKHCVLVIEKNASERKKTKTLLESHDIRTVFALDGRKGLEYLNGENNVNLLLLDLEDEKQNAKSVLREFRSSLAGCSLPVILLVPEKDREVEAILIEYGASDYLIKPIQSEVLVDRVKAALKRAEM